jgi:hypothetical protein
VLRLLAVLFVLLGIAPGCLVSPDPNLWRQKAMGDAGADVGADAPPKDVQGGEGGACSPTGTKASCDPVALSGCAKGTCYIAPKVGSVCVCPAGTLTEGSTCYTTVECKAGHLCAGSLPSGICRETCDPKQDTCPTGKYCLYLTDFPQWGFCKPKKDGGTTQDGGTTSD